MENRALGHYRDVCATGCAQPAPVKTGKKQERISERLSQRSPDHDIAMLQTHDLPPCWYFPEKQTPTADRSVIGTQFVSLYFPTISVRNDSSRANLVECRSSLHRSEMPADHKRNNVPSCRCGEAQSRMSCSSHSVGISWPRPAALAFS
jgi:hypothetical protein